MEEQIEDFRNTPKEAVFIFFLGVVNHWVTMVVHKEKNSHEIKFYYLDS